jgi:hypothetical protein
MALYRKNRFAYSKALATGWDATAKPFTTLGCAGRTVDASLALGEKENTIYFHVDCWPSVTLAKEGLWFYQPPTVIAIGGFQTKVKSARMLVSGMPRLSNKMKLGCVFRTSPDTVGPVSGGHYA